MSSVSVSGNPLRVSISRRVVHRRYCAILSLLALRHQQTSMVHQVVFHKSGNKVVTMIVAVVPTLLEIDRFLGAGGFEQMRM